MEESFFGKEKQILRKMFIIIIIIIIIMNMNIVTKFEAVKLGLHIVDL
jgi:hypothetical protein